nr:cytochrome oxidase small assembly protein [Azohydromonas caseinilytica]
MTPPHDDYQAQRRRSNLRLALILGSVAAAFALGFVAKVVLLGA